ncbi:hypothetical protein GCM10025862_26340 [Arsenicicoccus piscis]|uniref:Ribosomal RNA adenine methylase transferase N-terminal domain-containing protein n=1 Tax=Arsenicicoccus piscis TaxID=673954 RepID=A0ABQ6HR88_9MICO|nr:hypothetical protein GCM10025862_26340 [Arsenicicoccus piscis]
MPEPESPVDSAATLLGAARVRELADRLGVRPTKNWGQNFVVDANTVRRIVRLAQVGPDDVVVEVGPGLGSLTLALLPAVRRVVAVEVDPVLAGALPQTVAEQAPTLADRLEVVHADALAVRELPGPPPTALVANLPYNVSVPVVLSFLERFPSIERVLVMVQLEVAERLAAQPGSKVYGVPSVKAAWHADVRLAGTVGRHVFWPAPNVDSGLVELVRHEPPVTEAPASRCSPRSTRPSCSAARPCAPRWRGGPAPPRAPRRSCVAPGSTRRRAARPSTSRRSLASRTRHPTRAPEHD